MQRGFVIFLLVISLAACGQPQASGTPMPTSTPAPTPDLAMLGEAISQFRDAPATAGRPVRIYYLLPNTIRQYQPGQRVAELLEPTSEVIWSVPVVVNGVVGTKAIFARGAVQSVGYDNPLPILPPDYEDPTISITLLVNNQTGVEIYLLERNGTEQLFVSQEPGFFDSLATLAGQSHPPDIVMSALQQAIRDKCGLIIRQC